MGDKIVFYHLCGQLIRHGQFQAEYIAAHIANRTDYAVLAVRLLHHGTVRRGAVVPAAYLHHGADGAFPHGAGQVVGQCVGYGGAFLGDNIPPLAIDGNELLLFHLDQRVGKLKIIDKLLLQDRALHGVALYRACHFDQVAEQNANLCVVGKAAGTHTGGKCFCHRNHFLEKFSLLYYTRSGGLWQDGKFQK